MKLQTTNFLSPATRVAGLAFSTGLLAVATLALTTRTIKAQDLSLDTFATGAGKIEAITGIHTATQTGTGIVGGTRSITLTISSSTSSGNPFQQPIEVSVRPSTNKQVPSAFLWTVGYGAFPRIDLIYGETTPLVLNLTAYNRLRVTFAGLSNELNFNIVAWQSNGAGGSAGCNLLPYPAPFTVDFPLAAFVLSGGGTIDWSNIQALDIIFQGGNLTGSPNLAITHFSAVPASDPPGSFVCGATP